MGITAKGKKNAGLLTEGSIAKGILSFAIPLFLGQLLQQFYNVADAWVVGNFADNDSFAAVSSAGNLTFLIIGFFNGIAIGGGVVISKYFGARDEKSVLRLMQTPENVLPASLLYLRVYFAGVSTIIMYNIGMSIMRALGDSLHPLYYLFISSVINVVLDLLFVAVFHWGVGGAAAATIIAQGVSAVMCIYRMCKMEGVARLDFKKLHYNGSMMHEVITQGLPTGIQNSVISIGNIVIQKNINSFGSFAMAGVGAYSKLEGFAFLPITCMSMALPTFISQNLGAKEYNRAKKGAVFGIITGVAVAELIGIGFYIGIEPLLRFFVDEEQSVSYGEMHAHVTTLFFCLLAFSHCAAGVLRGCGKSIIPMAAMLAFWCGLRIVYVTTALEFIPKFTMISWAYPLTWSCSSIVFLLFLIFSDWTHAFEKKAAKSKVIK